MEKSRLERRQHMELQLPAATSKLNNTQVMPIRREGKGVESKTWHLREKLQNMTTVNRVMHFSAEKQVLLSEFIEIK